MTEYTTESLWQLPPFTQDHLQAAKLRTPGKSAGRILSVRARHPTPHPSPGR